MNTPHNSINTHTRTHTHTHTHTNTHTLHTHTYPRNWAPVGPTSMMRPASPSPSTIGGMEARRCLFTSLHVTRVGAEHFLGGTMIRRPLLRQPRMAPPLASTMKLTRKLRIKGSSKKSNNSFSFLPLVVNKCNTSGADVPSVDHELPCRRSKCHCIKKETIFISFSSDITSISQWIAFHSSPFLFPVSFALGLQARQAKRRALNKITSG